MAVGSDFSQEGSTIRVTGADRVPTQPDKEDHMKANLLEPRRSTDSISLTMSALDYWRNER